MFSAGFVCKLIGVTAEVVDCLLRFYLFVLKS